MMRSVACLALFLPGMALLLLVVQWSASGTTSSVPLRKINASAIPPLDPAQAMLDIEGLRAQRGSVLANTALEHDPEIVPEFCFEVDGSYNGGRITQVNAQAEIASSSELVQQLRKTARLLDEQANAKEDAEDYEAETALRNLASQIRVTAKSLNR